MFELLTGVGLPMLVGVGGIIIAIINMKVSSKNEFKNLKSEHKDISNILGSPNNTTLAGQHDEIKTYLEKDIKGAIEPEIKTISELLKKEAAVKEEREKRLDKEQTALLNALNSVGAYGNVWVNAITELGELKAKVTNLGHVSK
jgi:hypothetical protein